MAELILNWFAHMLHLQKDREEFLFSEEDGV